MCLFFLRLLTDNKQWDSSYSCLKDASTSYPCDRLLHFKASCEFSTAVAKCPPLVDTVGSVPAAANKVAFDLNVPYYKGLQVFIFPPRLRWNSFTLINYPKHSGESPENGIVLVFFSFPLKRMLRRTFHTIGRVRVRPQRVLRGWNKHMAGAWRYQCPL